MVKWTFFLSIYCEPRERERARERETGKERKRGRQRVKVRERKKDKMIELEH